jgi:hypothetical protein
VRFFRGQVRRLTMSVGSVFGAHTVRPRLRAILSLTATVLVVGSVSVTGPQVGLDPGWVAGLNLARETQMRYGPELDFTYGPWGFLDVPLAINRPDFVLGLCFSVSSVVAVWLLTLAVLRSKLSRKMALLTASLLTLTFSSVSSPSFLLAAVAVAACVCYLRQIPTLSPAWCPVAVACLAALLLQIKFSEGVAVSVFALATSLASPRARLMRTASSAVVWLVTSLALWVVALQPVSDIGSWLGVSTDILTGYTSAMSIDSFAPAIAILWYLIALLLVVSVLVLGWRLGADRNVVSHCGSLVVMVGALFFGFRQAFTRQSLDHNAAFFIIVALLLCILLERGPRWRATVLLIALSSLVASPALSTYVRGNPAVSWVTGLGILSSDESQLAVLDQARRQDQAEYGLPRTMVEATRGHAISVDPWEVSMVWAYSMKWRPMPVFQSYSAYTEQLDQLNADAAKFAKPDQMIIRETTISTPEQFTWIDGRNPVWESPRYTLAVVCNYSLVTADKRWMLLRKSVNRCGQSSPATAARQVSAGASVEVPGTGADQIVTVSFVPTKTDLLFSLAQLTIKNPDPLMASVDGVPYRLPEGLASGPLLMVLPSGVGWPADFRGQTSARSISFSRPGKVQFHTIQLIG